MFYYKNNDSEIIIQNMATVKINNLRKERGCLRTMFTKLYDALIDEDQINMVEIKKLNDLHSKLVQLDITIKNVMYEEDCDNDIILKELEDAQ